ncbi:hypothetical protein RRX38_23420 [Pseudomonas sp. DTU_2021_1001937_2_SI_NGA_ILE_001]|nr:hypothetical protein [Pseudomonas sp. DTU_2021_1001937_2_SI_NGA_ILE_001]WNW13983.1 hypothetical protein RRX38_23420 [Pseudomonas sp. DTU_2021_1001937_2_SI_NGA_ILE_001]
MKATLTNLKRAALRKSFETEIRAAKPHIIRKAPLHGKPDSVRPA